MGHYRAVFCINCLFPVFGLFVDAKGKACTVEKRLYNSTDAGSPFCCTVDRCNCFTGFLERTFDVVVCIDRVSCGRF